MRRNLRTGTMTHIDLARFQMKKYEATNDPRELYVAALNIGSAWEDEYSGVFREQTLHAKNGLLGIIEDLSKKDRDLVYNALPKDLRK